MPTRRSVSVKATTEGVVRAPSEFSRTRGFGPSKVKISHYIILYTHTYTHIYIIHIYII